MAETYCGKTCAECAYKEQSGCPGCKSGPGRQFGGDCGLAKCVREKGHETCDTCGFRGNCGTRRSSADMPEYRRRKQEAEKARLEAVARRAPVLGKWLWILFWLVVIGNIPGLMSIDVIAGIAPGVFMTGQILGALCTAVYGGILLRLQSEEDRYHTAGVCALIAAAVNLLVSLIAGTGETPTWTLVLTLPAAVFVLVGEYHEFIGHSVVLSCVDGELGWKWENLWKWNIGLELGMLGGIVIMLIIPFLGAVAVLGAAVGMVVVSILRMVYLYRTARAFRDYLA